MGITRSRRECQDPYYIGGNNYCAMFGNARIIHREERKLYPFRVIGEVMNVVLSLIVGLLIGLADFSRSPQRGIDEVPDVFSLVMADAIASMIESR
jgi:hypothetical protein